ncbi:uncharacterized protein F5147DRAFT_655863 [Suillus discolor]|uniref:Uncharacterized protein n=1 Tax=Suillus discolor TaxID=1912936 RepID=A0A9P7JQM7_9AGAM|nr:uncharacterized protein F5147DRAFT_655863 [Suillus discolor]KAG2099264.1 hypothetical protein F5147DRAFT_655863 [Suillus discolor]
MPEAANDALKITLATVAIAHQVLHPFEAGRSGSTEIGAGKRLKALWGKCYIISPQLLSCAAVVRQYSKGGAFETLPDWNSVVDDDPCIKSHPLLPQDVGLPVLSLQLELFPYWSLKLPGHHLLCGLSLVPTAVGPVTKQAPAVEVDSTPLSPLPTSLELEPLTPLAPSVASAAPSTARHKLFVPGNTSKKVKVIPHPRNDKKRKAEEDDTDSADAPRCPTRSHKPNLKKIKKLPSHDRQNKLRKTRSGTTKAGLLTVAHTSRMYLVADIGQGIIVVGVSGTQKLGWVTLSSGTGAEWNLLYNIFSLMIGVWIQRLLQQWSIPFATIRGNVTNARNQANLALFCRTKKSDAYDSFARIATGQRLLAQLMEWVSGTGCRLKPKQQAVTQAADRPKRSRSRVPKARAVSEMLKKDSPASLTMPAVPLSTPVVKEIDERGMTPVEETAGLTHCQTRADQPIGATEQEPTAKDILQAIRDLGSKFDLLATNERVDALDAKVNSVEEVFGHRLATLERLINSSDAQWKAMSSSAYAPPQHPTAQLPGWLHGTGGVDDVGISTVGRQWTHAWDPSVVTGVQGCLETSASAARTGYPHDTPVIRANSIESSQLSSTAICNVR